MGHMVINSRQHFSFFLSHHNIYIYIYAYILELQVSSTAVPSAHSLSHIHNSTWDLPPPKYNLVPTQVYALYKVDNKCNKLVYILWSVGAIYLLVSTRRRGILALRINVLRDPQRGTLFLPPLNKHNYVQTFRNHTGLALTTLRSNTDYTQTHKGWHCFSTFLLSP